MKMVTLKIKIEIIQSIAYIEPLIVLMTGHAMAVPLSAGFGTYVITYITYYAESVASADPELYVLM